MEIERQKRMPPMTLNEQQCQLMKNLKNNRMDEAIEQLVKAEETKLNINFYDNFEITPFMVVARCSFNENLDYDTKMKHKIAYKEI